MRKLDHKFWILWSVTFGMMLGMSVTLFVIFAFLRLNGVIHLYEGNQIINDVELVLAGIGIILSLVMPILGVRKILSGRKVSESHGPRGVMTEQDRMILESVIRRGHWLPHMSDKENDKIWPYDKDIDYNFMFTVVLPVLMKKFGTEYVKWRVHGWVTWHLGYDEGYRLTALKAAVCKMIKEGKDV